MKPLFIECEVKNGIHYVRAETVEKIVTDFQEAEKHTVKALRALWNACNGKVKVAEEVEDSIVRILGL